MLLRDLERILSKIVLPVKDAEAKLVNSSIPAGESATIDIHATDRTAVLITVRVTYTDTATAGVRVIWLYSPDGTNYDTEEDAIIEGNYFEPSFSAGETRQRSVIVPFVSPYLRFVVRNLDTANAVTVSLWTTLVK